MALIALALGVAKKHLAAYSSETLYLVFISLRELVDGFAYDRDCNYVDWFD